MRYVEEMIDACADFVAETWMHMFNVNNRDGQYHLGLHAPKIDQSKLKIYW